MNRHNGMNAILAEITARKRKTVVAAKMQTPVETLRARIEARTDHRSFRQAVARTGAVNLIAEVKKASPSAGLLRAGLDPGALAGVYAANGACAISVLTEEHYFHGSLADLATVRAAVPVPVLRKDFIIDAYQIYEAAAAGADAILLIAALLTADDLKQHIQTAASMLLDCLVEVHTEEDLSRARACGAAIIGINNRDLNTFAVDLETTARLVPSLPAGAVAVMESGIRTRAEIDRFRALGVNAFLVGETLVRASDPGATLRSLVA